MDYYKIELKGKLDAKWQDWFDGFEIHQNERNTVLSGPVVDQAALHGLLSRIRDLNLTIISVDRVEGGTDDNK